MTSFEGVDFPYEWREDHPEWTTEELGIYYIEGGPMMNGFYHWGGLVQGMRRYGRGIISRHTNNDRSINDYPHKLHFWVGNRPAEFSIAIFRNYLDGFEKHERIKEKLGR